MIVLTVGNSYIEIDGYASCIAYRELLRLLGIEAKFVSNAVLNYSVTNSLLNIPYNIDDYDVQDGDEFIILDLSNKEFFPTFVKEENIVELIDHHPGFEEYWNNKLKDKAIIKEIGAVATIIVNKYEESGLFDKMNNDIAKLLMAAILDNTLNFTAKTTTYNDRIVYQKLEKKVNISNFQNVYFSECQNSIENNLKDSIVNDMKHQKANNYLPEFFGQLTIWNINMILKQEDNIRKIMNGYGNEWIINIISLKDNISYIMCSNMDVRDKVNKLFNGTCDNYIVAVKPAMLRKEIIKVALLIGGKYE